MSKEFIPGIKDFVGYIGNLVGTYGVEIDLQAWHEIKTVLEQAEIVVKLDKGIKLDVRDFHAALDKLAELLGIPDKPKESDDDIIRNT